MNLRPRIAKPFAAATAVLAVCFLASAGLRARERTSDGSGWSLRGAKTGTAISADRNARGIEDAPGERKKKADASARKPGDRSSSVPGRSSDATQPAAPADAAMFKGLFLHSNPFPFPLLRRRGTDPDKAAAPADLSSRYDRLIVGFERKNGVHPALLKAVIWKESNFDRKSRGSKGEIGLMQILPDGAVKDWENEFHFNRLSRRLLATPELNIEIGSWYLGRALDRWKEYDECEALALCEYNAGLQRTNVWKPLLPDGKVIPYIDIETTRKYVEDILERRDQYERDWNWEKLK